MKIIEQAICFAAWQLLLAVLAATSVLAQTSGVPLDFGADREDLLFAYGFQYQATPRHGGATSDAYLFLAMFLQLRSAVDRSGRRRDT